MTAVSWWCWPDVIIPSLGKTILLPIIPILNYDIICWTAEGWLYPYTSAKQSGRRKAACHYSWLLSRNLPLAKRLNVRFGQEKIRTSPLPSHQTRTISTFTTHIPRLVLARASWHNGPCMQTRLLRVESANNFIQLCVRSCRGWRRLSKYGSYCGGLRGILIRKELIHILNISNMQTTRKFGAATVHSLAKKRCSIPGVTVRTELFSSHT